MEANRNTHTDRSGPAHSGRESARCCDLHASFTRLQVELENLEAQTVAQLKELCALHGLRKTGLKAELVARLLVVLST
jgi:hypothetical protein